MGATPLMAAATGGVQRLVDLLLDAGALDRPAPPAPSRVRPAHDHPLRPLAGADSAARDKSGRRASDYARAAGHDDLAARLERPRAAKGPTARAEELQPPPPLFRPPAPQVVEASGPAAEAPESWLGVVQPQPEVKTTTPWRPT